MTAVSIDWERQRGGRGGWTEALLRFSVVLGIVLALVTLVGHGIWVLIAAIFGGKSAR